MYQTVLEFWFEETEQKSWWVADPNFDELVRVRFGELLQQATRGELFQWRESAAGPLAEIIVLDQFSRNIHRDTPQAFSQDAMALALSQEAIRLGADRALEPTRRSFLYMPYMHSESPAIHDIAVGLFQAEGMESSLKFELQHKAIIDRFGRYPHRNRILGRQSTAEELEFLQQPGSSF